MPIETLERIYGTCVHEEAHPRFDWKPDDTSEPHRVREEPAGSDLLEKKYILTDQAQAIYVKNGTYTLFRIKAIKDFGIVNKGELGGWIQQESNLSHNGNCWVGDDAQVFDHAVVFNDAQVFGRAKIWGESQIGNRANVCDDVEVCGNSDVVDTAQVFGNAYIQDSLILGKSRVFGNTRLVKQTIEDKTIGS